MASAIPVLPDVASRMIESRWSRPLPSRSSIRARATRSLTEPVGFAASSFAKRRTFGLGESRETSTIGVPPIDSMSPSNLATRAAVGKAMSASGASGDRREQADLVPRFDRRRQPFEVPHIAAVDVDVDEPMEVPVRGQELLRQRGMPPDQRLHGIADRPALDVDLPLAVGVGAQDRRQLDGAHCAPPIAVPPTPNEPSANGSSAPYVDGAVQSPRWRAARASSE